MLLSKELRIKKAKQRSVSTVYVIDKFHRHETVKSLSEFDAKKEINEKSGKAGVNYKKTKKPTRHLKNTVIVSFI